MLNYFHLEGHAPPIEDLTTVQAYDEALAPYGSVISELFGYDLEDFSSSTTPSIDCPTYNLRRKGTSVYYIDCFIEEAENDDFSFRTPIIPFNENSDDSDVPVEAIVVGPFNPDSAEWISFMNDRSVDGLQSFAIVKDLRLVNASCNLGVFSISEKEI